jgi:LPS export ABC transporter permease LptF/LPS export ABC transporter permease LptG
VILHRYIAGELVLPACLALGGFTLVVLTKDFASFSELVVNRGVGIAQVGRIVLLQALPLMSQMLPFAVLVGGLVGLGRLSADLEILVMSALGVEPRRLIVPVSLFGVAAATVGLALSLLAAPWAHRGVEEALREIADQNPGAEVQPGVVSRFGDWKLEAREVSEQGQHLERVRLWIPSIGETVFAERAQIVSGGGGTRQIALRDGALVLNTREAARAMVFEELRADLPVPADLASSMGHDPIAGRPLAALLASANAPDTDPVQATAAREARAELHRRFVFPVAAVLFAALAVPLTLGRPRGSRSSGAVLGIAITVGYYGLVQLAAGLAERAPELVAFAAWLPNLALLVFAGVLYRRLSRPWATAREPARSGRRLERARHAGSGPGAAIRARRWPLPRYVASRFIQLSLVCFAALGVAYLLVDILERLDWFARHGADFADIVRFYSARIPLLVSRVVPMSLLVAMALTVSLLTGQGELAGMRACGISARKALAPTLVVCVLVIPLSFLLNDQIVPRTNELADLIKQSNIKGMGSTRNAVWNTTGRAVYELESLDLSLGTADQIVVYELGPTGLPESRIDAPSAVYTGHGLWRLEDASRVELGADGRARAVPPERNVDLGDEPSNELDLMHLSVAETRELIRSFSASGDPTTALEVDLHLKLATPLACLILPALVLLFAVSGPPFPSSPLTLVLAGGVAIGYTIASGTSASFGRGGTLPPWLAGWGPSLIACAAVAWLGWRARASQRGR